MARKLAACAGKAQVNRVLKSIASDSVFIESTPGNRYRSAPCIPWAHSLSWREELPSGILQAHRSPLARECLFPHPGVPLAETPALSRLHHSLDSLLSATEFVECNLLTRGGFPRLLLSERLLCSFHGLVCIPE